MDTETHKIYQPTGYEKQAVDLIRRERRAWEYSTVWVSDDASYSMREEVDNARKNYFGVFNVPEDDETEQQKLWIPMTEWMVERQVANVDLDTKDIHIKDPNGVNVRTALAFKLILLNFLGKMLFGEHLNDFLRRLCIDGTAVFKSYRAYSEEYKRNLPHLEVVDRLNLIYPPSAETLQEVPVIERKVLNKAKIDRKSWQNTEFIKWANTKSVPETVVYERWGKIPRSLVTGKEEDEDKWVEGLLIFSSPKTERRSPPGSDIGEVPHIFHHAEINTRGVKPYEEAWLKRVPGRHDGRGIPEQIKGLQKWLNTVVNIRRDELSNRLAGKYKIRKGSGITKQMLEQVRAGGAIPVDNMDDIQELRESDVKGSAYREPLDIVSMAERVSGAVELPSSPGMAPTTALVEQRNVKTLSTMIQEGVGKTLERLFKRHIIPQVLESLREGEILRITGDPEDLAAIDQAWKDRTRSRLRAEGASLEEETRAMDEINGRIERWGNDRPLEVKKYVFDPNYEAEVYVTAEKLDPSLVLRNLNDFMVTYGQLPNADLGVINSVVREYLNILEIPAARRISQEPTQPPRPPLEGLEGLAPNLAEEFERGKVRGVLSANERPETS